MAAAVESQTPTRPGIVATIAMMSGACAIGLVFVVLPPVLHQLAEYLGGGQNAAFAVQMMSAMPGLGLVAGGIVASGIIDRIGARSLLIYSLIGFMAFGSAGLYLDHLPALCVSRFLLGISAAGVGTSANTLIGHYFDGPSRGKMISAATIFGSLVCVIAMLASGEVAEMEGWRAPFAIYIATGFPLLLCAIFGLDRAAIREEKVPEGESVGTLAVLKQLWPSFLLITSLYVVLMMTSAQVSFLLAENGVIRPVIQARVLSMASTAMLFGALLYAFVQARWGVSTAFRLGLLVLGVGIVGFGLSHDALTAGVAAASKGLGSGLLNAGFIHMILNRAPPHMRGRALGLMTSSMFVGDFINPLVVAPIRHLLGLPAAFLLIGTAVLLGLAWSLIRRSPPQPVAATV